MDSYKLKRIIIITVIVVINVILISIVSVSVIGAISTQLANEENENSSMVNGNTEIIEQYATDKNNEIVQKGDINGDGKITTKDIELLKCFLINNQLPTERQLYLADMDNDEGVTVKDLSILISGKS